MDRDRKKRVARLQIIFVVVFLLFAAIILRLAQLQIKQGKEYAVDLVTRSTKKDAVPAMRGNIYDRNRNLIAESIPSFHVVFREEEAMEKGDYLWIANRLEAILSHTDKATILKRMDVGYDYVNGSLIRVERKLPKYLEKDLKSDLGPLEIAALAEHREELKGIEVVTKPIRKYNAKQIAVQAVGYVRPFHIAENLGMEGYKQEQDRYLPTQFVGFDGIELFYETELRGENGYRLYEVAADQTIIRELEGMAPVRGNDLILTLDERVQLEVREYIRQFLPELRAKIPEAAHAKGAYVVAMEIDTGKIVAMVSYPEYDPNIWMEGPDQQTYEQIQLSVTNGTIREAPYDTRPLTGEEAVQEGHKHPRSIVPSGSVLKPITILLGLQEGIITPHDRWNDPGVYRYGKGTDRVKNDNGQIHGILTPEKSLQKSSNTYMAKIGEQLARTKGRESVSLLQKYYHAFGIGIKTEVDLPYENKGKEDFMVMSEQYGPLAAMVQASFGQQARATAMQLAQFAATIANKGVRLKPQMVEAIISPDGKTLRSFAPSVISTFPHPDEYWDILTAGMVMVTKPGGTAVRAFEGLPYQVAAKTGTSEQDIYVPYKQVVDETGKAKTKWKFHRRITNGVSIAYAPADKPKLAVAVIVPEGGYGGRSAAVITRAVFEAYDKHIGLTPF
ncbi:penicillin-binding protein [Brevibacillus composti]|uniref:Penicillin-binding protein n=1 Tax=Brevibacillus composti TaxID=2796470 RepID=A0A7T5JQN2_9BACL|nr:penicillin-binding protein [Brevibacillus composti]QUO43587.1 penicillin-binding protein [Brevibacillus composti]